MNIEQNETTEDTHLKLSMNQVISEVIIVIKTWTKTWVLCSMKFAESSLMSTLLWINTRISDQKIKYSILSLFQHIFQSISENMQYNFVKCKTVWLAILQYSSQKNVTKIWTELKSTQELQMLTVDNLRLICTLVLDMLRAAFQLDFIGSDLWQKEVAGKWTMCRAV